MYCVMFILLRSLYSIYFLHIEHSPLIWVQIAAVSRTRVFTFPLICLTIRRSTHCTRKWAKMKIRKFWRKTAAYLKGFLTVILMKKKPTNEFYLWICHYVAQVAELLQGFRANKSFENRDPEDCPSRCSDLALFNFCETSILTAKFIEICRNIRL